MKIDHMTAYNMAIDLVKSAGFVFHHVAGRTETTYYEHPARSGCFLRVSAHKSKHSPIGLSGVVSRVSFTKGEEKHDYLTPTNVRNRVTWAIGRYFLEEPESTRYRGKERNLGAALCGARDA